MADRTPDRTPDQTPDEAPEEAADVRELDIIAVREGSFGVRGTGDTSGFGGLQTPVVMPAPSEPPFGGWFDEVASQLTDEDGLDKVVVHRGEITFFVRRDALLKTAKKLRDEPGLRFEFCSSISGVHYLTDTDAELHVVYHLLSMTHNRRIRLEVTAPDSDRTIPSVVSVYPTADWHERETWDMFGVVFDGHPALTRILMPDDWDGHPQRKDYPLGGIGVEFKGATIAPPDQRREYN